MSGGARWSFLRHGESFANAEGWLAGHTDVGLTPRGEAEARGVADAVRDLPFTRVLVSDLARAQRTLELAVPGWGGPVIVEPGVRERTLGSWDGAAHRERHTMAVLTTWEGRAPGGESLADLARRALGALAAHDTGEDTLVVTHGGLMRVVLGLLDGREPAAIARIRYPNCALHTRSVPVGTWAKLRG